MSRLRVLEIVGNAEGGGTNWVIRILRQIGNEHYENTLVAPDAPMLAAICRETGSAFQPLPLLQRRFDRGMIRHLRAIIQQTAPDVIDMHGTRAASYTLRALGNGPRPALVYSEHLFSFDARQGVWRWPWWLLERQICQASDAMATSCGFNADAVARWGWKRPEAILLRHYGIDQEHMRQQVAQGVTRESLGIPADAMVVGTVARLVPQKGMRYWIDAAQRIHAKQPNTIFLIVGDGELRSALEQQARHLGIAKHVRFLGASPTPWRLLAPCDVVTFSSLYEGLPQTGLEALAAGMPVVATAMGGTREIIRDGWNGLLVPTRNAQRLAEATCALLADEAMRQQMRRVGPPSIQDYVAQQVIKHYDHLYQEVWQKKTDLSFRA